MEALLNQGDGGALIWKYHKGIAILVGVGMQKARKRAVSAQDMVESVGHELDSEPKGLSLLKQSGMRTEEFVH